TTVALVRHHGEAVVFLSEQFVRRFSRKHGIKVRGLADDTLRALKEHQWPGHVRELQNVIERAVILCGESGMLEAEPLGMAGPSIVAEPATATTAHEAPAYDGGDVPKL